MTLANCPSPLLTDHNQSWKNCFSRSLDVLIPFLPYLVTLSSVLLCALIISLSSHIRVWSVVRACACGACACAWSSQCQSLACGHSPLSVNLPLPRHNQSNQAMATVIFVDLFNSFCIFLCIFFSVYLFLFISLCIFCNQSSLAMAIVIFVDEFLDHFGRHTTMVGTELTSGSFYGNVSGVIVPIHQSISSANLLLMAGHF